MICRLAAAETWPLRQQVLHPARPWPTALDPLDEGPDALHLGWREGDELVGVGSISRQDRPDGPTTGRAWRVRGMAVTQPWQGRGIGARILAALLAHAAGHDPGGLTWCLGRLPAARFYARHGFRCLRELHVSGKGPRLLLELHLPAAEK